MKTQILLACIVLFINNKLIAQQNDLVYTLTSSNERHEEARTSIITVANSKWAPLNVLISRKNKGKLNLGYTKQNRPVPLYYFPGKSRQSVLIIGGMHGSELSSIELAHSIKKMLGDYELKHDVFLIPSLFPDNAVKALGSRCQSNTGRYSHEDAVDPNRQMPAIGKAFNSQQPFDALRRVIEQENQWLLAVIQEYKPILIINLHAIKDVKKAGVFADPRTDCSGIALGYEKDSLLALQIAAEIKAKEGLLPGNFLDNAVTTLYHKDPAIAPAGIRQQRNLQGSKLPHKRGEGISLGTWATTAVCERTEQNNREAIAVLTIEFPGYKPSSLYNDEEEKAFALKNIRAYSEGILSILQIEPEEKQDIAGTGAKMK
jgi:hypothetical protein